MRLLEDNYKQNPAVASDGRFNQGVKYFVDCCCNCFDLWE
jgi:hypothetical protein